MTGEKRTVKVSLGVIVAWKDRSIVEENFGLYMNFITG